MANITISNLHPVGSALLSDSESFMSELSDMEEFSIQGGSTPACVYAAVWGFAFGVGFSIGVTTNLKGQEGDAV